MRRNLGPFWDFGQVFSLFLFSNSLMLHLRENAVEIGGNGGYRLRLNLGDEGNKAQKKYATVNDF